ncbi:MAG: helix-turn-helix transcriptional regulator [Deltaproteobacteria bacterium]|nr:helix-turn-helix transcriptional regulator [Deltaproteobacteria bacterium]
MVFLKIESHIASEGYACVGELGQDFGIVPSTISHHIKELRRLGHVCSLARLFCIGIIYSSVSPTCAM